jgi:hypothetical protein
MRFTFTCLSLELTDQPFCLRRTDGEQGAPLRKA